MSSVPAGAEPQCTSCRSSSIAIRSPSHNPEMLFESASQSSFGPFSAETAEAAGASGGDAFRVRVRSSSATYARSGGCEKSDRAGGEVTGRSPTRVHGVGVVGAAQSPMRSVPTQACDESAESANELGGKRFLTKSSFFSYHHIRKMRNGDHQKR